MQRLTILVLAMLMLHVAKGQLTFTVTPTVGQGTINCFSPVLQFSASSSYSGPVSYSWTVPGTTLTGATVSIVAGGNYIVKAKSGTLTATQPLSILVNTTIPVSTGPMTFTVNNVATYTFVVTSPTINFSHSVYSPGGSTYTASNPTLIYVPGAPGVYWYCVVDHQNGCRTCDGPGLPYVFAPGTYTPGIKELDPVKAIQVIPNPGKGLFKVGPFEEDLKITLYNIDGVLLRKTTLLAGQDLLDFSGLPAGVYYLSASRRDMPLGSAKIIVE